jgi:hypothetical protein
MYARSTDTALCNAHDCRRPCRPCRRLPPRQQPALSPPSDAKSDTNRNREPARASITLVSPFLPLAVPISPYPSRRNRPGSRPGARSHPSRSDAGRAVRPAAIRSDSESDPADRPRHSPPRALRAEPSAGSLQTAMAAARLGRGTDGRPTGPMMPPIMIQAETRRIKHADRAD